MKNNPIVQLWSIIIAGLTPPMIILALIMSGYLIIALIFSIAISYGIYKLDW